jgi:CBS domain-containing protein
MRRVRDIMIPVAQYPRVHLSDTLEDAISVMREAKLEVGRRPSLPRVLLVFDDEESLVGIVRRRDIMRGLEPKFLVDQPLETRIKFFDVGVDPHLSELSGEASMEKVVKGLRDQSRRPVSDVLRPIHTTLSPTDRLMQAVYEMVSLNESLIPVVENETIVGVIRSVDVLQALAELIGVE